MLLPTVILPDFDSTSIKQELISQTGQHFHQQGVYTNRKTDTFGYDYFKMADGDFTFTPIPEVLTKLCDKIHKAFAATGYNVSGCDNYKNVIVSYYEQGYQLEPHIDVDSIYKSTNGKPVNFYFGEDILGVIVEADTQGGLYFVQSDDAAKVRQPHQQAIYSLEEAPGLAYLLTGKLRHAPYYHGVSAIQRSRMSITFRTVSIDKP